MPTEALSASLHASWLALAQTGSGAQPAAPAAPPSPAAGPAAAATPGPPVAPTTTNVAADTGPSSSATTAASGTPAATPATQPQGPNLIYFIPIIAILFIFLSSGGRKEKKRRAEMLASLSRRDKVMTSGGVLGTVVEDRGDEVVLCVHEGDNTRVTFAKSAIQTIVRKADGSSAALTEAKPAAQKTAV